MTQPPRTAVHSYRAGFRQSWHHHEEAIVCLILAGCARERVQDGQEVAVGPLQVGVKPLGLRHTDFFGPGGLRAIRITYCAAELDSLGEFGSLLRHWRWTTSWHVAAAIIATVQGDVEHDAKHEVAAAFTPLESSGKAGPGWLSQAKELLHDCYRGDARLGTLASALDVHPVYLARVFRAHVGLSVGEYVRGLRLRSAVRDLLGSARSIAAVAAAAGFADQAHLTRVLRHETGMTPAELRRAGRSNTVHEPHYSSTHE